MKEVLITPKTPHKAYNNHRLLKIITVVLITILVLISPFGIYLIDKIDASIPTKAWSQSEEYNIADYESITIADDTLTILQLTDLHLIFGGWPGDVDTFSDVALLIDSANPDIVVVTGDLCFTIFNNSMTEMFIDFMADYPDIYWTFVFGNHDSFGKATKSAIAKMYADAGDKCLFSIGYTDLGDSELMLGNYPVYVKDSLGNIKLNLVHMDSGTGSSGNYGYFSTRQIQWYEWMINGTTASVGHTVPSIAYFHIPLQKYKEATTYAVGDRREKVCAQSKDDGTFYQKVVDLGSTVATFCGHDHTNDFAVLTNEGISLNYGRVSGELAWIVGGFTRGGTITEINLNDTITGDYIMQHTYRAGVQNKQVVRLY